MDKAESLMESLPDSSLTLLKAIDKNSLRSKADKARYALLMSMALDKNYVDTTTFDVLQPAIDYYLDNGTPDQKLRTYYYQGIIYLNKGDRDNALNSFFKGSDNAHAIHDSLTLAHDYVSQAVIYNQFYDTDAYTVCNLKAASIYKQLGDKAKEFDCLLRALNGATRSYNTITGDSIISLLDSFSSLNKTQEKELHSYRLSYMIKDGSHKELQKLLPTDTLTGSSPNDFLNMAHIYTQVGEYTKALNILNTLQNGKIPFDTIRFLALSVKAVEGTGDYKEALSLYRRFNAKHNVVDLSKFQQKVKFIEEKHQLELKVQEEAKEKSLIIWICITGIIVLLSGMAILLLFIRSQRNQKDLALQRAKNSELEAERLKAQNELTLQQVRNSELENRQLKVENALRLQQTKITELENENLKSEKERLSLDNRNLMLERDKKALEAENLSHRVEQLENESETLKSLLENRSDLPEEVKNTVKTRMEMLNSLLAGHITNNEHLGKPYEIWVKDLTEDTETFMNSNRLAFQASHPNFIKYFEDHDLTLAEINYVCLYAIGLKGKEVGAYMKKRSHVNISSAIRKKLGIDKHETNIGIYVRKLLKDL